MSSYLFWIADDGTDWGRSSVDRHGRSRIAPPDDARIVTEAQYREHLREIRIARDRAGEQAEAQWRAQSVRPTLVVEPAGAAASRQIEIAKAYLSQADTLLARLGELVAAYEAADRVTVSGTVATDASTYAEITYELAVEPLPAEISAIAGTIIHDVQAALDQAHKSVAPSKRVDGRTVRPGFPIPDAEPPGGSTWAAVATANATNAQSALATLNRIWGEVDPSDWKQHPMRRMRVLSTVERHQSVARVAATADVRGDGKTRVHGVGLGDDFTLPNRTDGTQHSVRFSLDAGDREGHIDRLRDLITRCEGLADDDISFAMYSQQEELAELQRELDSWYPPFDVEADVNSNVVVVAAGGQSTDLITELTAMADFARHALSTYQSALR